MLLSNNDMDKDTAREGASELQNVSNPHWFAGMSEVPGLAARATAAKWHNVSAVVGAAQAGASANRIAAETDIDPTHTDSDFHASLPGQIEAIPKADPITMGGFTQVTEGLAEAMPTIAASFVNPGAAFTTEFASQYGQGLGEGKALGLSFDRSQEFAAAGALPNAAGAILPGWGNWGKNLVTRISSRFVVGGAFNVAMDQPAMWARGAVLDSYGMHDQADQQRHYDWAQALTSFIMGGVMNQGGHAAAKQEHIDAGTHGGIEDHAATESAPGLPATPESQRAHNDGFAKAVDDMENGRPVDVGGVDRLHDAPFVMKTPEQLEAEVHAIHREALDDQLKTGEITPEQHAAALKQLPTYDGVRREYDAAEADAPGNLSRIQDTTAAAREMPPIPDKPVDPTDPRSRTVRPADALDSDDHMTTVHNDLRNVARSMETTHPEEAAQLHSLLDEVQNEYSASMKENEIYNIATACGLSFGD